VNHGGGRALERERGYYWIRPKSRPVTVGHWHPLYRDWIVCGDSQSIEERDVEVLSERLTPPEPSTPG
jgi:hypothetical protein